MTRLCCQKTWLILLGFVALASAGCPRGEFDFGGWGSAGIGAGKGGGKHPRPGSRSCGGLLGKGCADGEYCAFAPDAICGAADATGVCKVKPSVCTLEY